MVDAGVAEVLRTQHGVISRADAKHAGLSDRQIEWRVVSGAWVLQYRGVYRIASAPQTFHSELLAGCLATNGLASHRAAARLHGLKGYEHAEPEIVVAHGRWTPKVRIVIHQTTQMEHAGEISREGIPTTGLARTVLDLGAVVSKRRQGQAIDQLLRERRITMAILYRTLIRHARRGRDGCGPFRELVEQRFGEERVPLSDWSRWVAELLIDAGLSAPVFEHRVSASGRFVAQVDLAYPDQRLAIELDSREFHGEEVFERDRERWNRIVTAGWTLLIFTWKQYIETPWILVGQVADALAGNLEGT